MSDEEVYIKPIVVSQSVVWGVVALIVFKLFLSGFLMDLYYLGKSEHAIYYSYAGHFLFISSVVSMTIMFFIRRRKVEKVLLKPIMQRGSKKLVETVKGFLVYQNGELYVSDLISIKSELEARLGEEYKQRVLNNECVVFKLTSDVRIFELEENVTVLKTVLCENKLRKKETLLERYFVRL